MTVTTDWENRTWQVHFEGFLSLLRHQSQFVHGSARHLELARALQYLGDEERNKFPVHGATSTTTCKAFFLLDVSTLRMRALAHKFDALMHGIARPRKLDVQKLRICLKQIVDDVSSVSQIFLPEAVGDIPRSIQPAALTILASWLLLHCVDFLHGARSSSRERTRCLSFMSRATTIIHVKVAELYTNTVDLTLRDGNDTQSDISLQASMRDGLAVMWPLFAVCIASSIQLQPHEWARQSLSHTGAHARIPMALHLVRSPCP